MIKKYSKNIVYAIGVLVTLVVGFLFITESKKTNDYSVEAGAAINVSDCWEWDNNPSRHCHRGWNTSSDDAGDSIGEVVYEGFNNNNK